MNRSTGWQLAALTALILAVSHLPSLWSTAPDPAGILRSILSALLAAAILLVLLTVSRWHGWRVVAATFAIYWGISHFNTLIEAVFFGLDLGAETAAGLAWSSAIAAAVTAVGVTLIAGRWSVGATGGEGEATATRSLASWGGRFALSAFSYFILYFIAGMLVFPFVKEFYSGRPLPGLGEVFAMQIFRGTVYTAIGLLILRMVRLPRLPVMLLIGAALSILGGIAPLLPPNALMPEPIRNAHLIEVGVSNFLFGLVLARLLDVRARG